MGFKMKGSPAKLGTISGTAGHSSALKMKAEADAASALKQMTIKDRQGDDVVVSATGKEMTYKGKTMPLDSSKEKSGYDKDILEKRWKKGDKASGGTLNDLVKQRKGLKKGTPEYAKVQNKINEALGSKKRYDEGTTTTTTDKPTITTTTDEPTKTEKVIAKGDKKIGEVKENVSKKTAKIAKKEARKEFGKGSKEHLKAKKAHLEAKATDIQGGKGGRKRGLFRKLATKINVGRQKKTQAKIDALNEEEK
jgi:hypothetical protein